MGYMTTVTFLNDHWSDIKNDPQKFIDDIALGMIGHNMWNRSNVLINDFANGVQVAQSHHADVPRLYYVHQNLMSSIGYENSLTEIQLRKGVLKKVKQLIKFEEEEIKRLEVEQRKKST